MTISDEFDAYRKSVFDSLTITGLPDMPSPFFNTSFGQQQEALVEAVINNPFFDPKLSIRFLREGQTYKGQLKIPKNSSKVVLYVRLKDESKLESLERKRVTRFQDSGLVFSDIKEIAGASIGQGAYNFAVKAQEKTKENVQISNVTTIANQFIRWLGVNETESKTVATTITKHIVQFVLEYGDLFESENPLKKTLEVFKMMLLLGFQGLAELAVFLAEKVFKALAKEIRTWKLKEEQWNPKVKGKPYDPFIPAISQISDMVYHHFKGSKAAFKLNTKQAIVNEPIAEDSAFKNEEEKTIFESGLFIWIDQITKLIAQFFNEIKTAFTFFLKDTVQLVNAFVVGLINGTLEILAKFLDEMAEVLLLLDRENLIRFVEGIDAFIQKVDLPTLKKLFRNELKKLFNFLDGDDRYKNMYEFGEFIPKLIKIVIEFFFFIQAAISVGKKIPDLIKAFNEAIKDMGNQLILKIKPTLLKEAKALGIQFNVAFIRNTDLNVGFPLKVFDGKRYTLEYRQIELFSSLEDAKINNKLKEWTDNPNKLKGEYLKEKNKLLKNSKNHKLLVETIQQKRLKYNQPDSDILDTAKVAKLWDSNPAIITKKMTKTRAKALDKIRKANKIPKANIATGKIKVFDKQGNLLFERDNYIAHSGRGDKIKPTPEHPYGSVDTPNERYNGEKDQFFDPNEDKGRYKDSENPLLRDMEEDAILVADKYDVPLEELKVTIEIESTFHPCIVCQREINMRTELFGNTTIEVSSPYFFNGRPVKNNKHLNKYLNQ